MDVSARSMGDLRRRVRYNVLSLFLYDSFKNVNPVFSLNLKSDFIINSGAYSLLFIAYDHTHNKSDITYRRPPH